MDDIYDYPTTPIWSVDGTRLGRRYRIVAPNRPDYAYVPIADDCGYTSLRVAERCRRFTDIAVFRREVARLYVAAVGSPAPDDVTAFPDGKITAEEQQILIEAARSALSLLQTDDYQLAVELERLIDADTRNLKTLHSIVSDAALAWDHHQKQHVAEAGQVARVFPSAVIRNELERRLWERPATSLVDLLEPAVNDSV